MIELAIILAMTVQVAPPDLPVPAPTVSVPAGLPAPLPPPASPPAVSPPVVVPPASTRIDPVSNPPADLSTLEELPLHRPAADPHALSGYVRDEVRAGRCTAVGNRIRVDLAVLVAGNGQIRRIRPVAIQCPTVEQYASGIMLRRARSSVPPPGEDRWYRTAVDFAWP